MKKKLKKLRKKKELIKVLKGCFKSSIVYTELKSQTKDEWGEFVKGDVVYKKADEINANIKLLEWVLGG